MVGVNVKEIKEKCNKMNDAWSEGAPTVEFNGIVQTGFAADISEAAEMDAEIADMEAQIKMKKDVRDGKYINLNAQRTKVGQGVAGNKDFGDDSPLYGAMGFIRKSSRASGLTRKPRKPAE